MPRAKRASVENDAEETAEKGLENSTPAPSTRARKPRRRSKTSTGYKHDWYEIRTLFIEGVQEEGSDERTFLNLKELAERTGVSVQVIRERSADERWYDQREQYQLRMAKARQTKRILELSGESVDFDSKSLNVAKLGMAMVTTRMSEIAREVQEQQKRREEALRLAQNGYPIDPEDLRTVIDARELDTLSRAAIQWQTLGQKALGTDIQRMEIQQEIQANIEVDVEVTSISAELSRDDPERLAAFLQAAKRAGLLDTVGTEQDPSEDHLAIEATVATDESEDEIVEAEIVET